MTCAHSVLVKHFMQVEKIYIYICTALGKLASFLKPQVITAATAQCGSLSYRHHQPILVGNTRFCIYFNETHCKDFHPCASFLALWHIASGDRFFFHPTQCHQHVCTLLNVVCLRLHLCISLMMFWLSAATSGTTYKLRSHIYIIFL